MNSLVVSVSVILICACAVDARAALRARARARCFRVFIVGSSVVRASFCSDKTLRANHLRVARRARRDGEGPAFWGGRGERRRPAGCRGGVPRRHLGGRGSFPERPGGETLPGQPAGRRRSLSTSVRSATGPRAPPPRL